MRSASWCPDFSRDGLDCYPPDQAALTRLFPEDMPGQTFAEVREADMEINAKDFTWSLDGDSHGGRSLRTIMLHELGHVLGLAHPCEEPGTVSRTAQMPPCDASFAGSLMYPVPVAAGVAPVAGPTSGEVQAVCANYAD